MAKYEGEGYTVNIEGNRITFKGKMGSAKYSDLSNWLADEGENIGGDVIEVDVRDLEYSNSNGVRTLAFFFVKSPKRIHIFLDPNITWHRAGITPLTKMKDTIKIITE